MSMVDMLLQRYLSDPRIQQNPMANQAKQLLDRHDTEGLKNMAQNMAKEKGFNIDQIVSMLGLR